MHAIRTFVAIETPAPVQQAIASIQDQFRSLSLKASWIRPENCHLTLKFLGNIDPKQVPEIVLALQNALRETAAFTLFLKEVGVFPMKGAPRVLWVGLHDKTGDLLDLQSRLDKQFVALGFSQEKNTFRPHLTLARIKSPECARTLRQAVKTFSVEPDVGFPVDSVSFIKSQLTPKGSIYTLLKQFPLGPGFSASPA